MYEEISLILTIISNDLNINVNDLSCYSIATYLPTSRRLLLAHAMHSMQNTESTTNIVFSFVLLGSTPNVTGVTEQFVLDADSTRLTQLFAQSSIIVPPYQIVNVTTLACNTPQCNQQQPQGSSSSSSLSAGAVAGIIVGCVCAVLLLALLCYFLLTYREKYNSQILDSSDNVDHQHTTQLGPDTDYEDSLVNAPPPEYRPKPFVAGVGASAIYEDRESLQDKDLPIITPTWTTPSSSNHMSTPRHSINSLQPVRRGSQSPAPVTPYQQPERRPSLDELELTAVRPYSH